MKENELLFEEENAPDSSRSFKNFFNFLILFLEEDRIEQKKETLEPSQEEINEMESSDSKRFGKKVTKKIT